MAARPLARAAARLAQALRAQPDTPTLQTLLEDLVKVTSATADALAGPALPTYIDDLIDVYCEAQQTLTVSIPHRDFE